MARRLAIGEGLGALFAAGAAVIVPGRAVRRCGRGQVLFIGDHLIEHVAGGLKVLRLLVAADRALIDDGTSIGMGGLDRHRTGVPAVGRVALGHIRVAAGVRMPVPILVTAPVGAEGMARRLARGEGLGALFAAGAAVIVQRRAVRRGGEGQVIIAYHLLVEHMGVLRDRRGGRLGRLRHSGFRGGGLLGHKGIGHRAIVAPGRVRIRILRRRGARRRVHADQAGARIAYQPAGALHRGQFHRHVACDLLPPARIVHQRGHTELAAGGADDRASAYGAAGGQGAILLDLAKQDIVGEIAIHRHLQHSSAAPLLIGAKEYGTAGRGIYRLGGVHLDVHAVTAGCGSGVLIGIGAIGVCCAVKHIRGRIAPASRKFPDVVKAFLGQREIPADLAVQHRLLLLVAQAGVRARFLRVDMHAGQESQGQDCTQKQRYNFLKYRFSHRVQLLSHAAQGYGIGNYIIHNFSHFAMGSFPAFSGGKLASGKLSLKILLANFS